jgi:hypothetical protein
LPFRDMRDKKDKTEKKETVKGGTPFEIEVSNREAKTPIDDMCVISGLTRIRSATAGWGELKLKWER